MPAESPDLGLLPLKPPIFHILLALSEGDSHGYGVIQTVLSQSDGHVRLPTGAFYRHLSWLMKQGLVEESDARPAADDPRRGAYYRLSERGQKVLAAEGGRMADVVAVVRKKGLLSRQRSA